MKNTRLVVAALAAIALVLGGLIYRDVFVGTKGTANTLNLYAVARRTVTASVTGTGNLVPMQQANVSFKVSGTLTEIAVKVGDHVTAGQVLARIDPTQEQNALASAQANLAIAQANLQTAQTPLTSAQITQLRNNLTTAQQQYNDAVAQVNLTNSQDSNQVAADQSQLTNDQAALAASFAFQQDKSNLAAAQAQATTDTGKFTADGCVLANAPFATDPCKTDFTNVIADQTAVSTDQTKVNLDQAQVSTDQTKLTADTAKQQADKTTGQRSVNQASASVTSAQDNLTTQTESKPNQILSAQAQLASAQVAVTTAQQNLNNTTLVAPMDGVVNSINGVVGETAITGSGTTPEAPGTQAPLPTTSASGAFMVIGDVSGMEVVIPFAESDASKLAFNQDTQITFDAVPNLTISGHVVAVASAATVQSGVVNYYATVSLNQTNPALKQGMTSNASVTVSKATNAIVVPNLAITRLGGQAYVNIYVGGKEIQTMIQTGVVGDQFTEVTGGLNEGAQVVIPTLRVSGSTGGGRGLGTGAGGGVRIGAGG
ncbi:MAG TPA: biotin/lipoyl-binding protein [Candidatus Dormibacteraeota bacterium]|nr:biotin/lipoyl-binding protein [Candidatus Dormibacteraeota bacterium]